MIKVLFVCHGNICRSPMAEFVLRDMVKQQGLDQYIQVASCATSTEEIGNDVHYKTLQKLKEVGVPTTKRAAVQLKKSDLDQYDYFIGMDARNIVNIHRILGTQKSEKICRLLDFTDSPRDIADPWYTGNFDITYSDIKEGCQALLEQLKTESTIYNL